ncbi:interleukin-12 subunit beta [Sparus aurata]|uniref:Interleukin-12 subunit beta n=1 Tax=Sparus aurata TaxID=8175 RepID=A0A671VK94_SPAAU|nr:interleukin-12 subunit beta-like [Sparus aurata]XP_030293505.1 interleukin-12 subunit beta-like [Sparus aurata]
MLSLLLVLLCASLCSSSSDSSQHQIETLTDNVLVLRLPNEEGSMVFVPLTCGEAYQNQPVTWKKNGIDVPALQGNQVKVRVEEMNGGNYTCHLGPDGEYLNHTVIMIQVENRTVILKEKSPEEGHIRCSAPNYSGSFICTWTKAQYRSDAAVLLVKAERHLENIPCVVAADGSSIQCQDASCPFREEQHRIALSIYIYSYSRLEEYTKSFYLRDIVRPENLQNLHTTDGKNYSWNYPDSWEKPCSFFSLHFQVKVVHNEDTCHSDKHIRLHETDDPKFEIDFKTKRYIICVRAQDKHTRGPFGPWSYCSVNRNTVNCSFLELQP